MTRKVVSNDEFNLAYRGMPDDEDSQKKASDNRNIIAAVLRGYSDKMSKDDLHGCGLKALWRCLQYHEEGFGQKFTTSLHKFANWECRHELRRIRGYRRKQDVAVFPLFDETMDLSRAHIDEKNESLDHITGCIEMLPFSGQRKVLRQYYFDGLNLQEIGKANGYSKEVARHKLGHALRRLKEICHESLRCITQ